jgi:hypothetical protein
MLQTSRRFLRLTPAVLAFGLLAACVDPAAGPTASATEPLPKAGENVYVATMDAGIAIPALPVDKIPESHRRQVVAYETDQAPGTIIINPKTKLLYYVLGKNKAIRYGIAVGKAGFEWSGEAIVAEKKPWPRWIPPKEMIARKPRAGEVRRGRPARRPDQPAGRPRDLPDLGRPRLRLPHPRHPGMAVDRPQRLVGLHPDDQPGRAGSLQPREGRREGDRADRLGRDAEGPAYPGADRAEGPPSRRPRSWSLPVPCPR